MHGPAIAENVLDGPPRCLDGVPPHEPRTAITWTGVFEDSAVAARVRHIAEPANEQNLSRLQSVLAEGASSVLIHGA